MSEDKILKPEEAAELLGVKVSTLREYVRDGKLQGVKNVINDSLLGIRESELQKLLVGDSVKKDTTVEETNIEGNSELSKKKVELELLKVDEEIALKKSDIKDANELHERVAEVEERRKAVVEKESGLNARMELVIKGERELAEKQEQDKQMLLARINRIDQEDKKHKEAREKDDAKRQERHKMHLSFVDDLAQKIYNPPPQSISRALQEQLVVSLEPIMETFGLHPQFDQLKRYVPLEDRYGIEASEMREAREVQIEVSTDGSTPRAIQYCYKMCIGVYRWMNQEPSYGQEFCRRIRLQTRQLQSLVKNKEDDEITKQQEQILDYFRIWYKSIMRWAEVYQNVPNQDWTHIVDWLCQCAQVLEVKLGVGVVDDGSNSPVVSR